LMNSRQIFKDCLHEQIELGHPHLP
jgi:hypothetical protein